MRYPIIIGLLTVCFCSVTLQAENDILAIKAGTILTLDSDPIQAGVVLVQNGKILAIGSDVNVPEDAKLMDASKKWIMPGLVSAAPVSVTRGDQNEQSSEITPSFRIATAINPLDKQLKRLPHTGITTTHIAPGPFNVISGLGAVIKPLGNTVEDMMLKEDASLWITLGSMPSSRNRAPRRSPPSNFYYRRPTTRMSVAWMLRKAFFDAQNYQENPSDVNNQDMDILNGAMDDTIPICMYARRSTDIRMALNLAKEHDLNLTLYECTEGYQMADEIAAQNMFAILEPHFEHPAPSYYIEGGNVRWNNATILNQAGVPFALASYNGVEQTDLLSVAGFTVRHGLPREEALRAITLIPAEILRVSDRVGSLTTGKDADILILSGDPLKSTSRIERVLINGKTIFQVN